MTRWLEVTDAERNLRALVNTSFIRTVYPTFFGPGEERGCVISVLRAGQDLTDDLLVRESYAQVRDSITYLDGMVRSVKDTGVV